MSLKHAKLGFLHLRDQKERDQVHRDSTSTPAPASGVRQHLSPSRQFALFSLITLLILGGVQAWVLSRRIESQIAHNTAALVGRSVRGMVRQQLSAADLQGPMTGERYRTFNEFLHANALPEHGVAQIKVWNPDGLVVYADDPALIGQTFPVEEGLHKVFADGQTVVELASLQKPENVTERGMGPLLEIYVPLVSHDADEILGAYEVYLFYAPIAAEIRRAQATIWASVAAAMAGLWLTLHWVFARASRTVERAEAERAEAERKRMACLALLNEVGREAAATLEADELLQRAASAIRRRFGYYTVSVLLLDRESDELVLWAAAGIGQELLVQASRLKADTGIMGHVAQTGETYVANDVTRDPYYLGLPGLETRAELCVPLRREGAVIGVLNVESQAKNAFGPEDVMGMETLADQLAVALTNAQLYEEIRRLSVTDALTGLANRRHFDQRLADELRRARRYRRPLSAVMIDIDHFKVYNDTHGHLRGDEVLRQLAIRLRSTVRETDFVARYGGEEFVVLLPETEGAEALGVAEKIRAAVAAHRFPEEETQPGGDLTISLGVATFTGVVRDLAPERMSAVEVSASAEALIRAADVALYRAKSLGRNRVCSA